MARLLLLLTLLVGTGAAPAAAQVVSLPPRDDGASDPTFFTFRARLLEALAAHDTEAVLAAFAPDARLSFGDAPAGPAGVRALWLDGAPPGERDLWTTLARVVAMGSVRGPEGLVTAPYTYAGPPDDLDAFSHGTVVGDEVNVRASASATAEVVAKLSYAVVPVVQWGYSERAGERLWHRIRLADGREGYVAGEFVWSPVDYRVGFENRDGRWQIVFFVAGD